MRKTFAVLSVILGLASAAHAGPTKPAPTPKLAPPVATPTVDPAPHKGWDFDKAALVPILSGGRLKPLDSFARETVLFITGRRSFEGWNPIELLLSITTHPQEWSQKRLISIAVKDVRKQLLLNEEQTRFTPVELIHNPTLAQYANSMPAEAKSPADKELKRVIDRVVLFQSLISGDAWTLVPQPTPQAWKSTVSPDLPKGEMLPTVFAAWVSSYQTGNEHYFAQFSGILKDSIERRLEGFNDSSRRLIKAEAFYNRLDPFFWAMVFYVGGALFWLFASGLTSKLGTWLTRIAWGGTLTAVVFHLTGFGLRCYIAGRPPVSNMYESVIWVSFGILFFAMVLYAIHRQKIIPAVASSLAGLGLFAASAAPAVMDPNIHPLVPVLRSNYWLTIHVLTITLGYAAFALSLGIANVTLAMFLREARKPSGIAGSQRIANLNQLTYRAMQFGVVLLAAGTILGGVWADYSWGRFWGWDPKEVWALIALLTYVAILHGRFAGWVGAFGFAAWTVMSFLSVVMAWYGVNFVLGVGLHSYGFSSGSGWGVYAFCILQVLYVAFVALVRKRGQAHALDAKAAPA